MFDNAPFELTALTEKQQGTLLRSFLETLESKVVLTDDDIRFWSKVDDLSDKSRPLFLGLIATAIYKKGTDHIRHWTQDEFLKEVLNHEKKNWSIHFS